MPDQTVSKASGYPLQIQIPDVLSLAINDNEMTTNEPKRKYSVTVSSSRMLQAVSPAVNDHQAYNKAASRGTFRAILTANSPSSLMSSTSWACDRLFFDACSTT